MKFSKKFLCPFPKKDNLPAVVEEPSAIFADDRERLIAAEKTSRAVDKPIRRRIPRGEITLIGKDDPFRQGAVKGEAAGIPVHTEQERKEPAPALILSSRQIIPEKCRKCPDHEKFSEGELPWCPHCSDWISRQHFQGHVVKYHRSPEPSLPDHGRSDRQAK